MRDDSPLAKTSRENEVGRPLWRTLAIWFGCIVVLSCVAVGTLTYLLRSRDLQNRIFRQLALIRDDKTREVSQWFENRADDVELWSEAPMIVSTAQEHAAGRPINDRQSRRNDLDHIREAYKCRSVSIFDPRTGIGILSTETPGTMNHELPRALRERVLEEDAVIHSDVFICPIHHLPALVIAGPIRSPEQPEPVGILAFYMDLESWFYPRVLQTNHLGQTGEVLIVNREGTSQCPLRHVENAAGRFRIAAEPARWAAAGLTGTLYADDYYSVPVMAAYGYMPEVGWGLVAKQDQAEVLSVVRHMGRHVVFITIGAVVLALALSFLLARRIAAPAAGIAGATERVRAGEVTVRAQETGPREIRTIARNFNEMMDQLARQLWTGQSLGSVYSGASAHNRLESLLSEVLPRIMDVTRSQLGVFYLADGDSSFRCVSAYGVPRSQLPQRIAGSPPDHLLARTVTDGQVQVVSDLADGHELKIATQSGTTRPAALMSIPLTHSGGTIAIIGLASLHRYRQEDVDIARTLSLTLGQSIAAAQANEHNIRITEELRVNNEELSTANEELQTQTEELQRQSEELQQQAEQLARQRAQVEEADRLKSQFLSNVSHELRTPLNSIMALSQLMLARGTGADPQKESEYLKIVERNGRHLLNLINDILDLSKIESGRMDLSPTVFRPEHVVYRALEVARPLAESKGLRVDIQIEPVPSVFSDEEKTHQILLNLLSNAVKFTDEGRIGVRVSREGEKVLFAITDTGIGIAESEVSRIFDEFRQVDGSTTRRHEGTGLGLAIGRKLARLLGGEIRVQSEFGKGSTFTLVLPIPQAPPAARRVSEAQVVTKGNMDRDRLLRELERSLRQLGGSAETRGDRGLVLVVDDDEIAAIQISSALEDAGYEITVARNGAEAVARSRETTPDAMVLDIMMPGMDGFEVLRQIRSGPRTAGVPVVILTAKEITSEDRARLADSNVRQLIQKGSVDRDQLVEAVSEVLHRGAEPAAPAFDGNGDPAARAPQPNPDQAPPALLRTGEANEPTPSPEAPSLIKGTSDILVVEDNPDNLRTIEALLEDLGHPYVHASDGAQAVRMVRELRPKLVLMDIQLPVLSGMDAVHEIRSDPQLAGIPVVALTAKAMHGDRERILAAGCQGYLSKPLDRSELERVLTRWLGVPG